MKDWLWIGSRRTLKEERNPRRWLYSGCLRRSRSFVSLPKSVSQRFVIGPMLFLLYINDLSSFISKVKGFRLDLFQFSLMKPLLFSPVLHCNQLIKFNFFEYNKLTITSKIHTRHTSVWRIPQSVIYLNHSKFEDKIVYVV